MEHWNTEHRWTSGTLAEHQNTDENIGMPHNSRTGEHQLNNGTKQRIEVIGQIT